MRRADRLFSLIQLLRSGRLMRASDLADRLEVSPRTIYRDVRDLILSGVPIEGEAGVGYVLREGYDLPPLMFTRAEVLALITGARMAKAWGGAALGKGAESALQKIESVLPDDLRQALEGALLFAPTMAFSSALRNRMDHLQQAVEEKRFLTIRYGDEAGKETRRTVRPLALYFWGKVWTLATWCEKRDDFRSFRVDRIKNVKEAGRFADEPGKRLDDYMERVEREFVRAVEEEGE